MIAVILFSVATWIEGERPPPALPEREVTFDTTVRPDSAIRDDVAEQSCREAETGLIARVDAAQSCEVDADCIIFDYGYPVQCLTSVASSEISALRIEYRNYEQSCSFRVYYDCPSDPLERVPVCRNSRCAVELRTLDILKDRTYDHIGVRPRERP